MALKAAAAAVPMDKMRQALALQQAGEVEKAQRIYKAVLKKAPNSPDANHLLGVSYRQLGFPRRGLDFIRKAIALAPDRAPYHANLARTLSDIPGTPAEEVLAAAEKAVALNPGLAEAHNMKAIALNRLGRDTEAEEIFRFLIAAHPRHADAHRNYGVLLRDRGDHKEALRFFEAAALLDPDNPETLVQRSRARFELDDFAASQPELEAALARFPAHGDLNHEMARLMFKIGDAYKGLPYAEAAVADEPDNVHRQVTLGVILQSLGRSREAVAALRKARDNWREDIPIAEWNMSLAYLGMGDLKTGWDLHRARFRAGLSSTLCRIFDKPEWDGSDLSGKTILVWNDQGIGDALRNVSMLPELQAMADRVILEPPYKLMPLLQRSFPDITIREQSHDRLSLRTPVEDFDVQCSLTDLAIHLRRDISDFARARHPVLAFDAARARGYFDRLPGAGRMPVVGVAWRSGQLDAWRARWYLNIMQMAPILKTTGIVFVNLQYGALEREIRWVREALGLDFQSFDDIDLRDDLEAAAALTACVDLVISSNTSVADLAGAVDVPCWRFGPPNGISLLGQQNPPWHRSVTYYRMPHEEPSEAIVPVLQHDLLGWRDHFDPGVRDARLGRD
ncbi:tetratricopeptide repeat protein [Polymorphum gilvum]|uniref:TPR repeat n=1 Tax=Polymorphum gilvum (strain LMG 25793 / CGMCC 1.9160 / SL003B-26A1) TaxID=991905 RepID=F2J5C6_POLGS|nr:tetratricopeptide repeat protein [Polymorphum gilvum]ADZ71185.1 TPR repeat [Polymorphum gilvum SL003B-26A1]